MDDTSILILSRRDIAALMRPADYLEAVEAGFRSVAVGRAQSPPPLYLAGEGGGFHAKAAIFTGQGRTYAALKLNGNFPNNPTRYRLPTVQGLILLYDAARGTPLAVMDSIEVTLRRTAAASALAAKYLARAGSTRIAICGCGAQARAHIDALADAMQLSHGAVWDRDAKKAERFAYEMSEVSGLGLESVGDHRAATLDADIVVTCTTSQEAFLQRADVREGVFIAAIGADAPAKSEIHPDLMRRSVVVVDSLDQCAAFGDLRHAISAGVMSVTDVRADLAQLVSTEKNGRTRAEEIIVFDSTGVAIEDAASAAAIYERACLRSKGLRVDLSAG